MTAVAKRTQYRGAITRARLIEAAIDTLYTEGYAAASLPELCKRAGVSRGAQQHHFPTKAELLAAAVEALMVRRHEELRAKLPKTVREFVEHLWAIYSGTAFYVWLELAIAARTDPELRRHLAAVNERFYEEAKQTIRAVVGGDLDDATLLATARFVTSVMNGVAVNRILDEDDRTTKATLALFEEALTPWFPT